MNQADALQPAVSAQARGAYERRRRAAWIDYLRTTRGASEQQYHDLEPNAWEVLQRRLRRNDELLLDALR